MFSFARQFSINRPLLSTARRYLTAMDASTLEATRSQQSESTPYHFIPTAKINDSNPPLANANILSSMEESISPMQRFANTPLLDFNFDNFNDNFNKNNIKPVFLPSYSWVSEDMGPINDFRFTDKKRVVVILHGLLGCKSNWRNFTKKLSRKFPHWKFLTVDIRNHGSSVNALGPNTIENCATDVNNLVKELEIEPAVVCGHSFGGKVAMEYAKQATNAPQKVIIMDTYPGSVEPELGVSGSFGSASVPAMLKLLQNVPLPIASKSELVVHLRKQGVIHSVAKWLGANLTSTEGGYTWKFCLENMNEMYQSYCNKSMWDFIADPPSSVDVVIGENSDRWTPDALDTLEDQCLATINSRIFVVPDAGHWLHVDNPKGVHSCLSQSISETDRVLWEQY